MPDSVRVVTFQAGGQITEVAALQSAIDWTVNSSGFTKNSLAILRGERNQQMASRGGRYDGENYTGEKVGNGTYKFQVLLGGATPDTLITKMNALYNVTERVPGPLYIEHRDDGATFPSYYEIRAPAKSQENRNWAQRMGAKSVCIDVEWPVAPLPCGAPMDVTDTAVATNLTDYTFDSSSANGFPVGGGGDPLATERRLIHTGRGYRYGSHQVTIQAAPGPTITGYKLGAVVKRVAANSYVEVYVDDNGTNSRLRIDTINAGVRTNRFTTNLAARVISGQAITVRGRIEDSVVYAEYASGGSLTPMVTPTASGSYTLLAGDLALLGVNVQGQGGGSWIPQHANATVPSVEIFPYTYRNRTLPDTWTLDGIVPGDVPALGSVSIANGAAISCPFAMVAWTQTVKPVTTSWPFGVIDVPGAPNAVNGLASTADASCRGGLVYQTAAFAGTEFCQFTPDLTALYPDDAPPQMQLLEVWARIKLSSTLTNCSLAVSYVNPFGVSSSWSLEHGAAGKKIVPPSAGTVYRFVRLGIVPVPTTALGSEGLRVTALGGGGGTFGIDYLILNPAQRRALTPTGKVGDASYPNFLVGASLMQKDVLSTLEGRLSGGNAFFAAGTPIRATGMGGSQIQIPPGSGTALCCKLSSMVPDDPTVSATSETLTHNAMVRLSLIPRFINQRDQ